MISKTSKHTFNSYQPNYYWSTTLERWRVCM